MDIFRYSNGVLERLLLYQLFYITSMRHPNLLVGMPKNIDCVISLQCIGNTKPIITVFEGNTGEY